MSTDWTDAVDCQDMMEPQVLRIESLLKPVDERQSLFNEYGAMVAEGHYISSAFGRVVRMFIEEHRQTYKLHELEQILIGQVGIVLAEERIRQALKMKQAKQWKNNAKRLSPPESK